MGRRVRKFDDLSGRGLWIALRAMLIKSALRELPFCVIWQNKHSDELSAFGRYTPYPAVADFPRKRGRINRSMLSRRDMASLLSIHSAPSKRGKGGGASHQRGNLHRPQGGCMVFAAKGGIKNGAHKGAHIASAAVLHNSRGRRHQPSPAGRQPSGIPVSAVPPHKGQ